MIKLCRYVSLSHDWDVCLCMCESANLWLGVVHTCPLEQTRICLLWRANDWLACQLSHLAPALWCHVYVSQTQKNGCQPVVSPNPEYIVPWAVVTLCFCSWLRFRTQGLCATCGVMCMYLSRELVPTCRVAKSECFFAAEQDKHLGLYFVNCSRAVARLVGMSQSSAC